MSNPEEDIQDNINKLNRNWWSVFNEVQKCIARGDLLGAEELCEESKKVLKDALKGDL